MLFCGFLRGVPARGGQARLRDSPVRLHCCWRGECEATGGQPARSTFWQFCRPWPEVLFGVGCQVPKVSIWRFHCVGEARFSKLLRGASIRSCAGEAAAIPFGKCCASAWPAPVKRRRRRDGEVHVARDAYPQSPSWLPGCRRHPTLRWCRVGWLPCTLETYCACEAHDLIGMGAERHRKRTGLRRSAASRHPRVAATGPRWNIGRDVYLSRPAAAKVEVRKPP